MLGQVSIVYSWWNLYFSYFHSTMIACKLEFSPFAFSKGYIYPSAGPVDVCHLAFLVQATCWLRGTQTVFEMSTAERLESLLPRVSVRPLVYMYSISQRDDGWKCVWIYLTCPSTLYPLIVLKAPGAICSKRVSSSTSSISKGPAILHLSKYHYWHSDFLKLWQLQLKEAHKVSARRL